MLCLVLNTLLAFISGGKRHYHPLRYKDSDISSFDGSDLFSQSTDATESSHSSNSNSAVSASDASSVAQTTSESDSEASSSADGSISATSPDEESDDDEEGAAGDTSSTGSGATQPAKRRPSRADKASSELRLLGRTKQKVTRKGRQSKIKTKERGKKARQRKQLKKRRLRTRLRQSDINSSDSGKMDRDEQSKKSSEADTLQLKLYGFTRSRLERHFAFQRLTHYLNAGGRLKPRRVFVCCVCERAGECIANEAASTSTAKKELPPQAPLANTVVDTATVSMCVPPSHGPMAGHPAAKGDRRSTLGTKRECVDRLEPSTTLHDLPSIPTVQTDIATAELTTEVAVDDRKVEESFNEDGTTTINAALIKDCSIKSQKKAMYEIFFPYYNFKKELRKIFLFLL
ncbi:unnamed protein product [Protopolystoma xenopodis]|uniref:Uncharacterized protein n=1 Tax=Protopolystoma xenopodis TaxID=117903 RepID=A0A448WW48_9PLAT|nr:unnamed protein product [Protopolystoma xenopodis]